jgi:membrane-bound lytic murein transglycosylase D
MSEAFAQNPSGRNKEFQVPEKLRARVNFWKDIFTKYGRGSFVVHHRHYPQIVFMVVDLTNELETLDRISFDNIKRSSEKKYVEEVRRAIELLARGEQPTTYLQKFISRRMEFLGPGSNKYKDILDNDLIRTQTGIKEKFAESIQRSGRYLPLIENIFIKDYNMPVELTRLPFIESSFDYTAYSSVGAAGIWQFMPRTGRLYMTVGKSVDERRDPLESSRAAARYLREAYNRLNSWPLAITSYNHGVAGVANKVSRAGTSDISALIEGGGERVFGFASSNFYPEFLAALEIYDNYRAYFPGLRIEQPIRAREVLVQKPIFAHEIAQQLKINMADLKEVNYALMPNIWSGRAKIPSGYRLKVPDSRELHLSYSNTEPLIAKPSTSSSSVYGGNTYKVRKGDTLVAIAKRFGISVGQLKAINNIGSSSIKVGQNLVVGEKSVVKKTSKAPYIKTTSKKKTTTSKTTKKKKT